jgi:hypothetical protein
MALAETLFRAGKQLLAQGKVAEACAKFAESQRTEPALGTLLNLAACHEREGKTASAWAEFQEVAMSARRQNQPERESVARERKALLEPKLSRLEIRAEGAAKDLRVTLDARPLGAAVFGVAMPIDPGEHVIEATAPGKRAWKTKVAIAEGPSTRSIAVPALAPEAAVGTLASTSTRGPDHRVPAMIAAGVGAAAIGIGAAFGAMAFAAKSDGNKHCEGTRCDPEGLDRMSAGKRDATISTISFGVGLLAIGAGAVLFFTSKSASPKSGADPRSPIAVDVGPGRAALVARGAF